MAQVIMSLEEYDELKSRMDLYESIVNAITSPKVDQWSLDYYNSAEKAILPVGVIWNDLPDAMKFILEEKIKNNFPEELRNLGNYDPSKFHISLGQITHPPKEENCGETPEESSETP